MGCCLLLHLAQGHVITTTNQKVSLLLLENETFRYVYGEKALVGGAGGWCCCSWRRVVQQEKQKKSGEGRPHLN